MSYGALAAEANHVRDTLSGAGIGHGDRVATVIPNGPELAVLVAGVASCATVVPLNPTYKTAEFETLLSDVGARAVVLEAGENTPARAAAAGLGLTVIELAAQPGAAAGTFRLTLPGGERKCRSGLADAGDIALVLHTSGTTSRPKRVPLTHANLMNSAANFRDWYALTPCDRALSVMPYFHIQGIVGGILAPLLSGGSMVCARGFDGDAFFALLDEFRATWYTAGPTFHQAILARASRHGDVIERCPLRFIRSSSAPLAPQTMQELEQVFGAPVLEGYGLTETCLHSLSNPLPPDGRKPGCVGLSAGTEVAIMDDAGTLLAPGLSGEVVLRGATVMGGYEDNPAANAAAFAGDWFRTGDQGHFDEDGYLVLTGRYKELINRGGEKIAPVEIDHVLLDHPDVAQAVAFSVPHPTLGEEVGAAIVRRRGSKVCEADIRAFAGKALASFKVPRHVVFVEEIPKSTIGKSQRLGLADKLDLTRANGEDATARRPETSTELAIAEIWRSVLRAETIGLDEDFQMLGGDSLQAIHVIADIEMRFGIAIPAGARSQETGTIAGLAALVERLQETGDTPARSRPGPEPRDAPLPASFTQQTFWVGSRIFRDYPIHNVTVALRLAGPLNLEALRHGVASLAGRHEVLRSRFVLKDRQLLQVPLPAEPVAPEVFHLQDIAGGDIESRAMAWARQEAQRPLDIVEGPLWRIALLVLDDDSHILLAVLHHAIADGWGSDILIDDLLAFYATEMEDGAPLPAPLELQCADFAAWQRRCWAGGEFDGELVYWRDKLAGAGPVLRLPADRPRPEVPDWHGRKATMTLPPGLAETLRDLSRRHHATLFMTLLAAFDVLLSAQTGVTDIVIGVPAANRPTRSLEGVVGCFMNSLPYRTGLEGDPTFEQLLERVRLTAMEAYANQQIPLQVLVEQLLPSKGVGEDAFFCMLFQLRSYRAERRNAAGGLTIAPFDFDPGIAGLELAVDWEDCGDGLTCGFTYRCDLFDDSTIAGWMADYRTILETLAADPKRRLSTLEHVPSQLVL